jgi:hypothetical protein
MLPFGRMLTTYEQRYDKLQWRELLVESYKEYVRKQHGLCLPDRLDLDEQFGLYVSIVGDRFGLQAAEVKKFVDGLMEKYEKTYDDHFIVETE